MTCRRRSMEKEKQSYQEWGGGRREKGSNSSGFESETVYKKEGGKVTNR